MARRIVAALPLVLLEIGACRALVDFSDYASANSSHVGADGAEVDAVTAGDATATTDGVSSSDVPPIPDGIALDAITVSETGVIDAGMTDAANQGDVCADTTLAICLPFDGDLENHAANGGSSMPNGSVAAPVTGIGRPAVGQFALGGAIAFASTAQIGADATVEAWIRPTVDGSMTVFEAHDRFAMTVVPGIAGTLTCSTATGGLATSTGPIPKDVWTHVACRFDAQGGITAFRMGIAAAPDVAHNIVASGNAIVGQATGATNQFVGYMNNLRVFVVPRTNAEIIGALSF
jgi:hypothetical protein